MSDDHVQFLRANTTRAEGLLWHQLRRKRVASLRFRRQFRLDRYVVDFVCLPARLIVEIDGPSHEQTVTHDEQRTRWLQGQGFRVIRFRNDEVFSNLAGVVLAIESALHERRTPSP